MIKFNTIIPCLFLAVLTVDSIHAQSGNVGIGTDAPGSLLHLYSTLNGSRGISIGAQGTQSAQQAYLELITEGAGIAKLGEVDNKGWHFTARGAAFGDVDKQNDLLISNWNGVNWKEIMFFETSGNIGVGTTAPGSLIHVFSTSNGTRGISIDAEGTQSAQQAYLELITEGDGSAKLGDPGNKGWHFTGRGAAYGLVDQQNDLLISNWNGSDWSDIMHFETSGNVGIGANAPGSLLHLFSTDNETRGISIDAEGTQSAQQAYLELITEGDGTAKLGEVSNKGWHFTGRGAAYGNAVQQNDLLFSNWNGIDWKEIMFLETAGNVGVGTSSPLAKFHILGNFVAVDTLDLVAPDDPPVSGAGTRMMWYPAKAAFRAGHLYTFGQTFWDKDSIGDFSVAFGEDNMAKGDNSSAFGAENIASGVFSFALGVGNTASGSGAMATGNLTEASGNRSVTFGANTVADGVQAIAAGNNTLADALDAFALGRYNVGGGTGYNWISTDPLFEIGIGTDGANRANAVTVLKNGNMGVGTASPGSLLHLFNTSNTSRGISIDAQGTQSLQQAYLELITEGNGTAKLGEMSNKGWHFTGRGAAYGNVDQQNDLLFSNWNGTNWKEVMFLETTGNVGIGTSSPSTLLHIKRGTGSGNPTSSLVDAFLEDDFAYLEFSGSQFGGITFKDDGASLHAGVLYNYQNDWLEFRSGNVSYLTLDELGRLALLSGGKIGIGITPQHPLHVESSTADRTGYFYNTKNTSATTYGIYAGAFGAGSGDKRGGSFDANGGTGTNIGVRATAIDGTTNIGVYASATGGTTNWAGHFDNGNVIIDDNLGVGTANPTDKLNVSGGDVRIDDNNPFVIVNSTLAGQGSGMNFKQNGTTTGWLYFDDTDDVLRMNAAFSADRNDLVVTSAGDLGIGTMTPSSRLHVYGGDVTIEDSNNPFVILNSTTVNNNAGINLKQNGTSTGWMYFDDGENVLRMSIDAGGNRNDLVVTSAGKVGIGLANPDEALHVEGTIEVDQQIKANDAGGLEFATDDGIIRMKIHDNGYVGIGTTAPEAALHVEGNIEIDQQLIANDVGGLEFLTDDGIIRMKIQDNGYIGIGTTAPQEALHVEGNIEVDQQIKANDAGGLEFTTDEGTIRLKIQDNGYVGVGTTSPNKPLHVLGEARFESNSGGSQIILDGSTGLNEIEFQDDGVYGAGIGYSITDNRIYLYHGGNVIVKNGNLGVGVAPTHKIDVLGGAYCTGATWTNASSRALKENFHTLDNRSILDRLVQIPVSEWNYISEGSSIRRIGPMAEDFYTAFELGEDDKTISTVDITGVSVAAIQALYEENIELKAAIQKLTSRVEVLETGRPATRE